MLFNKKQAKIRRNLSSSTDGTGRLGVYVGLSRCLYEQNKRFLESQKLCESSRDSFAHDDDDVTCDEKTKMKDGEEKKGRCSSLFWRFVQKNGGHSLWR